MKLYLVKGLAEEAYYVEAPTLLQAIAVWQQAEDTTSEPESVQYIGSVTRAHPPVAE